MIDDITIALIVASIAVLIMVLIFHFQSKKLVKNFSKIKKGLSKNEVIKLLGKTSRKTENELRWLLGRSKDDKNFIFGCVHFNGDKVDSVQKIEIPDMSVKVLGIIQDKTSEVITYSLLVTYRDGTKEVVECKSNSEDFKKYMSYIDRGENNG